MTGGLQQQARVLRSIRSDMDDDDAQKIVDRIQAQMEPPQIYPAEEFQSDDLPSDPIGLIRSIGWRRLAIAAAFAVTIWTATAAFAVMAGGAS